MTGEEKFWEAVELAEREFTASPEKEEWLKILSDALQMFSDAHSKDDTHND